MPATPEQLAGGILGGERAAATHRLNADTDYGPLVPLIRDYRTAGWSYPQCRSTNVERLASRKENYASVERTLFGMECRQCGTHFIAMDAHDVTRRRARRIRRSDARCWR